MQLSLRHSKVIDQGVSYVILAFWTIVCLFPIYWLIVTSFKLPIDVFRGPKYFPWIDFTPTLDAWLDLLGGVKQREVVQSWVNSAVLAVSSSLLAVSIGGMAAYALTRFQYLVPGIKWKNNDIAFWIISQRILPPVVSIIPFLIMYRIVGLVDTHAGMILAYTTFNLPFAVWILRDFFQGLPVELEESALMDGATRLRAFIGIVLPISIPGFVATFLFCLVFTWNDYLFALMLTYKNASTLPMFIAGMAVSPYGPQWWSISALSLLAVIPMTAITIMVERFITRGLLVGAIK